MVFDCCLQAHVYCPSCCCTFWPSVTWWYPLYILCCSPWADLIKIEACTHKGNNIEWNKAKNWTEFALCWIWTHASFLTKMGYCEFTRYPCSKFFIYRICSQTLKLYILNRLTKSILFIFGRLASNWTTTSAKLM